MLYSLMPKTEDIRAENEQLIKLLKEDNAQLRQQLYKSEEAVSILSNNLRLVQEQMALFKRHRFGASSERISNIINNSLQPELLNFPAGSELPDEPPKKPKNGKSKKSTKPRGKNKEQTMHHLPEELHRNIFVIEPEEKAILEAEGKTLREMERRFVEKLAVKPLEFYVNRYEYPKYVTVNEIDGGVIEARAVEAPIEKSKADPSLLVFIATMKGCFHLPLYRIQEFFRQYGIAMSRQTLCNYYLQTAEVLEPIANAIKLQIFMQSIIYVDETTLKYKTTDYGGLKTGYIWVCEAGTGPAYRYYEFTCSREHEHAFKLFRNYEGDIMADGYGAYQSLEDSAEFQCRLHCCWAHVRRKFTETMDGDLVLRDKLLLYLTRLYRWEAYYWKADPSERQKIRNQKMKPLAELIFTEGKAAYLKGQILPRSKLCKALEYMLKREEYLKRFLDNPDMRIDNNTAERAIRPFTIGRKNWLFAGSIRGGKASATLNTIIQSCRAMGVDPNAYLAIVLKKIQTHPASRIDELLPHHYAAIPHKEIREMAAA